MTGSRILELEQPDGFAREEPVGLCFDEGTLLLEDVGSGFDAPGSFVFDDRVEQFRAPALAYRVVLAGLLRAGYRVRDEARGYREVELEIHERLEPYEHQSDALAAWKAGGRRGMVVLPTGSGKTYVAQLALEDVGRSTLVVVPTIDLMNQWSGVLEAAFGQQIGLIGGGYHEIEDVTVCTYDSAAIHMERLGPRFGMLVFDEAHHLPGDVYRQASEFAIAPFRLGLTATPERSDGRETEYDDLVGPIVYRKSIKQLSGHVLSDYEVRRTEVPMTESDFRNYEEARAVYRGFVEARGIRMSSRSGWPRFLAATNRSEEGRRALEAYQYQKQLALVHDNKLEKLFDLLARHHDDRCIVFTNDNDSVYRISERALIPAITHQTKIKERKEILRKLNDGEYRAVVTSKVLNEGVDVPEASIAIVLSGTGSVREHVQRLGRILRRREGKSATLYELITKDSVETFVSERRRKHDAYE